MLYIVSKAPNLHIKIKISIYSLVEIALQWNTNLTVSDPFLFCERLNNRLQKYLPNILPILAMNIPRLLKNGYKYTNLTTAKTENKFSNNGFNGKTHLKISITHSLPKSMWQKNKT